MELSYFVKSRLESKIENVDLVGQLMDVLDFNALGREELLLNAFTILRKNQVEDSQVWKVMALIDGALNIFEGLEDSRATIRRISPVEAVLLDEKMDFDVRKFLDLEGLGDSLQSEGKRADKKLEAGEDSIVATIRNYLRVRVEVMAGWSDLDVDYDSDLKAKGWRIPEKAMIESAFGRIAPLASKRTLILDTPRLLEWQMLEGLGADEAMLTVVEKDRKKAAQIQALLPRARVIPMEIKRWLIDIAKKRLEPKKDHLKTVRGLDLDRNDFASINDIIFPQGKLAIGYDPRKLAQAVLAFRNDFAPFEAWVVPLLKDFNFHDDGEIFFDQDPQEKFGLVSLDTKGLFDNMRYEFSAMGRLGFWSNRAVICTNFYANRESVAAQDRYKTAFFLEDRGSQGDSYDWLDRIDDSLEDRRDAISLDIVHCIRFGTGQYNYVNRYGEVALAGVLDDMIKDLTVEDYRDIFLDAFNELVIGIREGMIRPDVHENIESRIRQFAYCFVNRINFRKLIKKVFNPMVVKMDRFNRRKISRFREKSAVKYVKSREDIGSIPEEELALRLIGNLMEAFMDGGFAIRSHQAYSYQTGRSRMFSDFVLAEKEAIGYELSVGDLKRMYQSLIEGRMIGNFDMNKVLESCFQCMKNENLRAAFMKNIRRERID